MHSKGEANRMVVGNENKLILYLIECLGGYPFYRGKVLTATKKHLCNITGIHIGSISTTIVRCIKKKLLKKKLLKKGGREATAEYQVINVDENFYSRVFPYNSNNIRAITTTIEGKTHNKTESHSTDPQNDNPYTLQTNINHPSTTRPTYTAEQHSQKTSPTHSTPRSFCTNSSTPTTLSNNLTLTTTPPPTTTYIKYEDLPPEWRSINYHLLDHIHFKQHHIVNLYKLNILEPEIIQESINHFAYGLKNNPDNYKKYTDPFKVFYGRLRKGEPWTESTYKSPNEIATEELIQKRKAEKRKIANETCKLVDKLEQEGYRIWHSSLTEEEKKEIRERHDRKEAGIYNPYDDKVYKLHYAKYIMEDHKDPAEIALEAFIEKRKAKEEAETQRVTEMLQKGGLLIDYYKWQEKLTKNQIKEITGEEPESMTAVGQGKLKKYYVREMMEGGRE